MTRVYAPPELRERLAGFAAVNGVSVEVVAGDPCNLRVVVSTGPERLESRVDTLEANGWIKCATAWTLAEKHGIPLLSLGALLNELDIKIRHCSLGCFK